LLLQVEKQKIIKDSAGKLLNQGSDGDTRSEALSDIRKKAVADSIAPALHSSKRNSTTLQMQPNSASSLNGKDPTPAKKHSNRATNFFDR
jgi:chromosome transmission fidelity protein 18